MRLSLNEGGAFGVLVVCGFAVYYRYAVGAAKFAVIIEATFHSARERHAAQVARNQFLGDFKDVSVFNDKVFLNRVFLITAAVDCAAYLYGRSLATAACVV